MEQEHSRGSSKRYLQKISTTVHGWVIGGTTINARNLPVMIRMIPVMRAICRTRSHQQRATECVNHPSKLAAPPTLLVCESLTKHRPAHHRTPHCDCMEYVTRPTSGRPQPTAHFEEEQPT